MYCIRPLLTVVNDIVIAEPLRNVTEPLRNAQDNVY